jgi:hypothetical protein
MPKISALTLITDQAGGDYVVLYDASTTSTKVITVASLFDNISPATFGDGTNEAAFAADGELTLAGTARVTKSLWLNAGGIRAPGGKPATFVSYGLTGVWQFADQGVEANQETVSGTLKIPDEMDITVAPTFHVGWSADGVSPGNCEWQLEYLWISPDEATDGAAQETLTITVAASATADGFVFSTFTGIDAPSGTDKAMLWRIKRLSAGGNDTIVDTVEMRGCAFAYTANKLGTAT